MPICGAQQSHKGRAGFAQLKKTRRGKRAGRNVRERASFEGSRLSTDSARDSVDGGRPSMEMRREPREARASLDAQRPSSLDQPQVWLRPAPCIETVETAALYGRAQRPSSLDQPQVCSAPICTVHCVVAGLIWSPSLL